MYEQLSFDGLDAGDGTPPRTPPGARRGRALNEPLREKTIARFWSRVIRTPECFFWTGSISSPDGYGRITFLDGSENRTLTAHRFALILAHGQLDDSVVGEHECNETLCVRVDDGHLKRGTQSSNLAWAVAAGRHIGPTPAGGDPRGRYGRALAIRAALSGGYDRDRLQLARTATAEPVAVTPTLF